MGLDLCYEKLFFIFHIEKIALFFIFELRKRVFHSLDLNPSVVVVEPEEMEIEEDLYYLKFSETERDLIFEYFKHFISNKILPRQHEIMTFLAKYNFKDIVWTDIKQKIQSKIGNEGKKSKNKERKNERKLCLKKEEFYSLDN